MNINASALWYTGADVGVGSVDGERGKEAQVLLTGGFTRARDGKIHKKGIFH